MTSQGHPYARLDRALAGGDPLIVRMAAHECDRLSVADALRVVLVHADREPERYPRLAAGWAALLVRRTSIGLAELEAAVAALVDLGQDPLAGRDALLEFAAEVGLADVAAAVRRDAARASR